MQPTLAESLGVGVFRLRGRIGIADPAASLRMTEPRGSRLAGDYIMAVGGAGSSGRPAFASGTNTITATRIAKAITALTRLFPLEN